MAKQIQNKKQFEVKPEQVVNKIPPASDTPSRNPDEFLEQPKIIEKNVLTTDIVADINSVVMQKLKVDSEKPLQPNPLNSIKGIDDSLTNIIKPLEKVVDTPAVLKNNKEISQVDRISTDTFTKIVATPKKEVLSSPPIVYVDMLSDVDKRRLASEEQKRRLLEDSRRSDIEQSFVDEQNRRTLFDEEIQIMKLEFEQYLKSKYPEFDKSNIQNKVVSNPPSPEELQQIEAQKKQQATQIAMKKQEQQFRKNELQKNKLQRLDNEKERKSQENQFKINKLRMNEVQTFLEEDVIIEQKEKLARNPEIENLNEVEMKKREIEQYERRLGRPIIPHRDIVESEESDLDPKAYTNSDDILIKIPTDVNVADETDKLNKLLILRQELEKSNGR